MPIYWGLNRLICVFAFGLVVTVAQAAAEEEKNSDDWEKNAPKELLWEAVWQSNKTLESSITDLYVGLYNAGILPMRLYTGNTNRQISKIMIDETHMSNYPEEIDSILCDVNSHICIRKKIQVPTKDLTDATKHVGGFLPSKGNWKNSGTQDLFIPDIELTWSISLQPIKKPQGTSALEIVTKFNLSCEQNFKQSCEQLINALNARNPSALKADVEDEPVLPVPSVITAFPADIDPQRPWKPQSDIAIAGWRKEIAWSEPWLKTWQKMNRRKFFFEVFKKNLYSQGVPKLNGHPSEPLFGNQEKLLRAISHPFSNAEALDRPLQTPIKVGILDTWLYESHCDLPPACKPPAPSSSSTSSARCLNIHKQTLPALTVIPADTCAPVTTELTNGRDHGTHITGLIAAEVNQKGIVGLNPYASIYFFQVDKKQISDAAKNAGTTDDLINPIISHMLDTDVINISWFYDMVETKDAFVNKVIKRALSLTLFVAAAGNDSIPIDLGSACEILPACAGTDNLISVIGLTADVDRPLVWKDDKKGSNYGDHFDIAAVAENVLSLTSSDYAGALSGTSQAAPQVTAAASLLYALHESNYPNVKRFLPIWVKNRLMYTADLFPELIGKVWSGRLNVNRALLVNKSSFNYNENDTATGSPRFFQKGYTSENCNESRCESDTFECESTNNYKVSIPLKGLRRMWKNKNTDRYIVFYNESREHQDETLIRITDCKLISVSQVVEVFEGETGTKTFSLGQVTDFVSAMY